MDKPREPATASFAIQDHEVADVTDSPSLAQWALLLDPRRQVLIHVVVENDCCRLMRTTDAATTVLGYKLHALATAPDLCDRLEADERIRLLNSVRKAAASNRPCVEELRYVHPATGHRQLSIRAVQAKPGSTTWHALIEDITDQGQADHSARHLNATLERRVAERTNELLAKTRQLEAFTYSVSHDLKAPLRGIDGYSRLLVEQYGGLLDAEGQLFIENIRQSAKQMTQLIEDLMTYSRLERAEIRNGPVDLALVIEGVLDERRHTLSGDVEVKVELGCQRAWGETQAVKLALRNLIDNALKFSAQQAQRRITIGSIEQQGRCRLWVRDNGPGFDMRYHDRIFEIFQRLHRIDEVPGTGVGLAIVRKAMERMGGRTWAESQPGEGACFYLEMPAALAVSEAC